jgi:hypothetical protein
MVPYLAKLKLFVFHLGHVFTKQFLLTLTVGVAFGFSFAFMILNATSLNRTDMFLGPPPAKYSMDVHDHEVSLTETSVSDPIYIWIRTPDQGRHPNLYLKCWKISFLSL